MHAKLMSPERKRRRRRRRRREDRGAPSWRRSAPGLRAQGVASRASGRAGSMNTRPHASSPRRGDWSVSARWFARRGRRLRDAARRRIRRRRFASGWISRGARGWWRSAPPGRIGGTGGARGGGSRAAEAERRAADRGEGSRAGQPRAREYAEREAGQARSPSDARWRRRKRRASRAGDARQLGDGRDAIRCGGASRRTRDRRRAAAANGGGGGHRTRPTNRDARARPVIAARPVPRSPARSAACRRRRSTPRDAQTPKKITRGRRAR